MNKERLQLHRKRSECGQSTVAVALSLGVFLLLLAGVALLGLALLTTTSMREYDQGGGFFGDFNGPDVDSSSLNLNYPEGALVRAPSFLGNYSGSISFSVSSC